MKPDGAHTHGPGGGVALAVIAAVILIGSGAASAIASALAGLLVIVAAVTGVAVLAGIAWLVRQARQDRPGAPIAARSVVRYPPGIRTARADSSRPAIEPPREVHLHLNVTPGQLAAIMRHHTEEDH
ncbi:MAG: hypothetical protein ACRDOA_24160 [Streptosporangiaceae bacterium]